jgi:hypothetical protein
VNRGGTAVADSSSGFYPGLRSERQVNRGFILDIEGERDAAETRLAVVKRRVLGKRRPAEHRKDRAASVEKGHAFQLPHAPLHAERFIETRRAINVLYAERDETEPQGRRRG